MEDRNQRGGTWKFDGTHRPENHTFDDVQVNETTGCDSWGPLNGGARVNRVK